MANGAQIEPFCRYFVINGEPFRFPQGGRGKDVGQVVFFDYDTHLHIDIFSGAEHLNDLALNRTLR